ncbi:MULTISPECIES: fructose-bisphosphatase class II family protein [unclassified Cryobacterium]|uniref:fructose-bisphosphatase class II family protein n=2 Tax=Cryobacterium TaxID=69578 RepID=UPI001F5434F9|nr:MULTISPECIES: fructose-bisphosphatase class II [unclassified Cryobacterium]MDY7529732.1 fructose-bisphosphatase class II [Cryobacterium sp. 10C2]MEB0001839.1 fructose-bisphosphatase class II [Cryobacterium sp. RTC2.1]MEB0202051.1 fructose-bisphosphatase class II [Cryobacterium sp. 5I3]MEB0286025.1 fructose-bisphosphatase class II [Cryobacterium sp. 10S3]MEB0289506.1 fructose-bisphosphatase class II [Cryobacterium sp. 10C2]
MLGAHSYPAALVARVREATDAAAAACLPWLGRGDKIAIDDAAVTAMRDVLADAPFEGTVVIGEGEKDAAPMLANGEALGQGGAPLCDVAVDPLDGTRLAASGLPGSICVIALAPRGTMFDPVDVFYMDKLICGAAGHGVVDIRRPIAENLARLAAVTGVAVSDLVVVVLDKPRHAVLIAEILATGAELRLVGEGDIVAAVAAATSGTDVDVVVGIGGTPEGIIAACAVRALGGFMQGRLAPQTPEQHAAALAAGHDLDRVLELDDLVASEAVLFVSSAVG